MRTNRTATAIALVAMLAFTASAGAVTSAGRTAGVLELDGSMRMAYAFGDQHCPPGTPKLSRCVRFTGTGPVPGLGAATVTYTKVLPPDDPDCQVVQNNTAVLDVAGKGRLELSRAGRLCGPYAPATTTQTFEVTGATGIYAGASGRLHLRSVVHMLDFSCNCGKGQDTWTGTLTVPGAEFDVAPPRLAGAAAKAVRASGKTRRVRVRYSVTAEDAVDGPLTVACAPASGSAFRIGTTRVTCSATDSSGNTGRASFAVVVKRG